MGIKDRKGCEEIGEMDDQKIFVCFADKDDISKEEQKKFCKKIVEHCKTIEEDD